MLNDDQMSDLRADGDGKQEAPGCSLTRAVEDISQHSFLQTEALKEKQRTLGLLQAALSDVEEKGEVAEQELRCKVRETFVLEGDIEHLERHINVLHNRCASISKENAELQIRICEEEENARMALAGFNTYRNKMEGHRAAVFEAASQTEAHKELEKKRALVKMLMQRKEEIREQFENFNGSTAHMAKRDVDALKEEISAMRRITAEREEELQIEFDTHIQIKKDIKIQNRRYEAIVKRLHCQLSRAQAVHRQMSEDIYQMERQLAELKKQQEPSQDSVVKCTEV